MKRFWKQVGVAAAPGGWQVALDGRAVKTVGGRPQIVPTRALADAMAAEWEAQGEEIDPGSLVLRDLADYAIDVVTPDPAAVVASLLPYAETDTLCYRAEPDEPLHARQIALWEPLLAAAERRYDVHFERVSGIMHRPEPAATMARLAQVLASEDPFRLAALNTVTSLAASLVIGLAAIAPDADVAGLWQAASLEEEWQAELWGRDAEAEERQVRRFGAFQAAARFARLSGGE